MKRSSLLDDLSKFPWWVSAFLAVVAFVLLRFIFPALEIQSPLGKGLQTALPNFAWLLALFLLLPAVMSASREWRSRTVASKCKSNLIPKENTKASKPSHRKEVVDMLMEDLPASGPIVDSQTNEKPVEWTEGLLNQLEWKRFEELCRAYFEIKGFTSKTTRVGADGGVDINLYKGNSEKPAVLVQCKAWST